MPKEKIKIEGVATSHTDLASVLTSRLAHSAVIPEVQELFITERVNVEVRKQTAALSQLDAKISTITRDLKRLKADVVNYDGDGNEANSYWSKKAIDDKKRLTEELNRCTAAFDKALQTGDFESVYKLTANPKPSTEGGN